MICNEQQGLNPVCLALDSMNRAPALLRSRLLLAA
jgi:hypothetical protein